jgi:hypothetical protein
MATAYDASVASVAAVVPRPWWVTAVALIAAFSLWTAVLGRPDFPLDDAYITLHNAQVLLDGVDPNYGVSPLVGATSSVHVLIVAFFASVIGLPWGGAVVAWLGIAFYVSGILFVAQRCTLSSLETAGLLVAGTCGGMSAYHLLNGLETGLAMAAVVWALALSAGPPSRWLPVLLGTMPFLRPELALLSGALFLRQIQTRWRYGSTEAITGDAVVLALAATPWLGWSWTETGALVTQTAATKRAFFAQAALPLLAKIVLTFRILADAAWHVGPLAFGLLALGAAPAGRAAQFFIVTMLVVFGMVLPGGLDHNLGRYLYVLIPMAIVGLAHLRTDPAYNDRRWPAALIVSAGLYAIVTAPMHLQTYFDSIAFTRTERATVADWVRDNVPDDTCVAVHDAGYLAFATGHRLIDIVGLKTPGSVRAHEALTAPSAGADRGRALAQIVTESRCDHLVVYRLWDEIFAISAGLRAAGMDVTAVRSDGEYIVFRVQPPG